jgi:hypothetical protein
MYEASREMTWVSGPQSCAQKLSRPEEKTVEHYSSYDCLFHFGASKLHGPRSVVPLWVHLSGLQASRKVTLAQDFVRWCRVIRVMFYSKPKPSSEASQ